MGAQHGPPALRLREVRSALGVLQLHEGGSVANRLFQPGRQAGAAGLGSPRACCAARRTSPPSGSPNTSTSHPRASRASTSRGRVTSFESTSGWAPARSAASSRRRVRFWPPLSGAGMIGHTKTARVAAVGIAHTVSAMQRSAGQHPAVSVIVPVKDRAELLPATLRSVGAQTLPVAEVIVVDDGSRDDSARVAESLGATRRSQRRPELGPRARPQRGTRARERRVGRLPRLGRPALPPRHRAAVRPRAREHGRELHLRQSVRGPLERGGLGAGQRHPARRRRP